MNQNGGICNNRDPLSALGGIGDGPGGPDD